MAKNCGIFILTQNTVERKIYLKTCLYFLFRNFNKRYNYPIIILHEGDYDDVAQDEIKKSVREEHRHVISFKTIDKEDFEIPQHINQEKVNKIIALQPVPYWRNLKYRLMCYFWVKRFFAKYTEGYDYVMRLDDDSIIEEPLKDDLFKIAEDKNLAYLSNLVHIDCGICNYGMKELFETMLPEHKDKINNGMFIKAHLRAGDANNTHFERFRQARSIIDDKECTATEFVTEMPLMYYNNFFITSTAFWKQDNVRNIIDKIDEQGGIFYYRYGDAPIHTIITTLLAPERISRAIFKYSKRLQREAFIDSDNVIHSYMPKSYDKSSCITDK
jgi:alpha 1,2-mannosyltransferase